eukprot:tig00000180_g13622.t1
MFTMPAGHGLGSGRGLFQAIAGAASVIYKYSGELDAATELLDRALYCLEAAWCGAGRGHGRGGVEDALRRSGPHVPGAVRPLLENYNVKPDSGGARGWAALHRRPLFDDDEPAASVELPP